MYSGTCLKWSPTGPHVQWNLIMWSPTGPHFLAGVAIIILSRIEVHKKYICTYGIRYSIVMTILER